MFSLQENISNKYQTLISASKMLNLLRSSLVVHEEFSLVPKINISIHFCWNLEDERTKNQRTEQNNAWKQLERTIIYELKLRGQAANGEDDDEGGLRQHRWWCWIDTAKNRKEQLENIEIITEEFTAFEIICFQHFSYCSSSPSSLSLNTVVWFWGVRILWSFEL